MVVINGSYQNANAIKDYLVNQATQGKLYLAVGTGLDSWDDSLPAANTSTTRLANEAARSSIKASDIVLIDSEKSTPDDDVIGTAGSSNVIRILGNIVCPLKPLREYGLFVDASDTLNSGLLYSYDVHSKIVLGQLHLYMKYIYLNF